MVARRSVRKRVSQALVISNAMTGESMGRIGNLSVDGMMLITTHEVPDGCLYQVQFQLRDAQQQVQRMEIGIQCLWRKQRAPSTATGSDAKSSTSAMPSSRCWTPGWSELPRPCEAGEFGFGGWAAYSGTSASLSGVYSSTCSVEPSVASAGSPSSIRSASSTAAGSRSASRTTLASVASSPT